MLWWTLRQLKSSNEAKRIKAVKSLGRSKDARAFEHLIPLLTNDSGYVRAMAAYSLGEIGDRRAVEPLRKLLEDCDNWRAHSRERAVKALRALSAHEPVKRDGRFDGDVRENVIVALSKFDDEQVKKSLIPFLQDASSEVCQAVAEALEKAESPEVKQALAQYRRGEERRKLIREALKKRLTLQEALIFVERRTSEAGFRLSPSQRISVTEFLLERRQGQKVAIAIGDEIPVATFSALIMSLVSYGDRSLIVTDSPELARDFFKKGKVSDASGLRASDVARRCGRTFVDADSLFESQDFQSLEEAASDLDTIVVMAHPTHRAMRSQHDKIYKLLKSTGDLIKVSPGGLISHIGQYFS